jgi:tRNA pseudouridine38-40 synthase
LNPIDDSEPPNSLGGGLAPRKDQNKIQYKMTLAYDGGAYHGWQKQASGKSIQDKVDQALSTMLRHDVRSLAASRTDSGVHATGQMVSFRTHKPFEQERWLKSMNGILPRDIRVLSLQAIEHGFHPIRSATGKLYCYRIWLGPSQSPLLCHLFWHCPLPMDIPLLRQELLTMVGIQNFTSYCAGDSSAKTRVRNLSEILIKDEDKLLEIWFLGEGFLKQMIRNLVGTAVGRARGKIEKSMLEILEAKDRRAAGSTAPAQGLSLVEVFYEKLPDITSYTKSLPKVSLS